VFCEKPIAKDIAETIEAINACKAAGVQLMTALQRRFDPNFARVKKAITDREVGETIAIKLCSRDPAPPPFEYVKDGGGLFVDMAVHDLDSARARARAPARARPRPRARAPTRALVPRAQWRAT
jgi:myo-inositol 2-dehydrogenase/D-chiro-inositol 1-dehydrogenase